MSRIGMAPIPIPQGVTVQQKSGTVTVKGPKGELSYAHRPEVKVKVADDVMRVERAGETKAHRAFHGLTRALLANMVQGVDQGFRRELQIVGVGYRAEKRGKALVLNVGYSHPVEYPEPEGITLSVPSPTTVVVEGPDKQKVGQVAAEVRAVRPPEPYKGKGIRYTDEHVRRKAGKTGA